MRRTGPGTVPGSRWGGATQRVANRVARLETQVRAEERTLTELEGMARSLEPAPTSTALTAPTSDEMGEERETPEPTEYERIRASTGAALAVRVGDLVQVRGR